jgi:protein TonB
VLAWIERHKRYPPRASDRRLEGEAVVALTLDRRGRLRRVELIQSSGHPLLDEAAIDAVQRADPFPRSETGGWTRRRFEVPLRFRPARP